MKNDLRQLIGKRVLIEGEVGSGKTAYLQRLVRQSSEISGVGRAVVIDMAPGRRAVGGRSVGGRLKVHRSVASRVEYVSPGKVSAPRLEGGNAREVRRLARANALKIEKTLRAVLAEGAELLFINDLTVFLHAGDAELLLGAIAKAGTFVGTAYKGSFLSEDKGSGIAAREMMLLEKVEEAMDVVILL